MSRPRNQTRYFGAGNMPSGTPRYSASLRGRARTDPSTARWLNGQACLENLRLHQKRSNFRQTKICRFFLRWRQGPRLPQKFFDASNKPPILVSVLGFFVSFCAVLFTSAIYHEQRTLSTNRMFDLGKIAANTLSCNVRPFNVADAECSRAADAVMFDCLSGDPKGNLFVFQYGGQVGRKRLIRNKIIDHVPFANAEQPAYI